MPCLIFEDGHIVDVNPALCRLLGIRRNDIVGLTLDRFIAPEGQDEWFKQYGKLASSQHRQFEIRLQTRAGASLHALANCSTCSIRLVARRQPCVADRYHERKLNEERVLYLAFYDIIDGPPNRFLLSERIAQALLQKRQGQIGLMFIDPTISSRSTIRWGTMLGTVCCRRWRGAWNVCVRRSDTVASWRR